MQSSIWPGAKRIFRALPMYAGARPPVFKRISDFDFSAWFVFPRLKIKA